MFLTALIALTTLLPHVDSGFALARGGVAAATSIVRATGSATEPSPRFVPEARAVTNWREQAGDALRPASLALVVRFAVGEPAFVARCVKLNNYWCIKRARWDGEIGADAEGHTGFATAADGADAAAQLLRRYYREFGRRTAIGIVRRWAPSECRIPAAGPVAKDLAPQGIGKTLRARFLARNTRAGMRRRAVAARTGGLRVQPWSALARKGPRPNAVSATPPAKRPPPATPGLLVRPSELLVTPSALLVKPSELLIKPSAILEKPSPRTTRAAAPGRMPGSAPARLQERFVAESAALPSIVAGLPNVRLLDLSVPSPICSNDETRIRNYAERIGGSVGAKVDDDLALFGPDGRPLPNLRAVMLAMSAVELGTLRAGPALVEAAIARLVEGPVTGMASPNAAAAP